MSVIGCRAGLLEEQEMVYLLVGGDSEIASAAATHLNEVGLRVVATTRRADRLGDGRVFFDLAAPIGDWLPPEQTTAACIFAAVARLADCHGDPAGSALINVTRTLTLVERLVERGIYVLFLSTNQVFDGSEPWVSARTPHAPISEYGRQKARTETALREMMDAGAPVAILRLAKVVSPGMALLQQWQAALAEGRRVQAFRDMVMAPVRARIVAAAIRALLSERNPGIWQLSGPSDISYAQIGAHIARRVGAPAHLVEPVAAASAGMPPGSTPRHTTLDSDALRDRFGVEVPEPWSVMDELLSAP
jgi:dTDP-4-dehydrorhamnose reductase